MTVMLILSFDILVFQNLLCVKEINTPNRYGGLEYMGFEKLTFVPIQVCQCVLLLFLLSMHYEWQREINIHVLRA